MADPEPLVRLESFVRLVTRGAASARDEARRVLDELVARGDLDRAEAAEIEAAVSNAAEHHRRWLDERVLGPLRSAWRQTARAGGDAGGVSDLLARLDAIEARLARIERALGARGEDA